MRGRVFKRGATWTYMVDAAPRADGRRRQRKKGGFRTRKEAEAALTSLLTDMRRGVVPEPSRVRVGEYLDEWLGSVASSLRPTTVELYRHATDQWIKPRIGGLRLQAVTPEVLDRFYAELSASGRYDGSGLGPRSVRLAHQVLRKALARAASRGRIVVNPAAAPDLALPRRVREPLRPWTGEEARRFLRETKESRLAALWALMVSTGVRRGEALGLSWDAVDLDLGRVAVVQTVVVAGDRAIFSEPKTAAGRRLVELDPGVVKALKAHRSRQASERLFAGPEWQDTGLVFATAHGGVLHPRNVARDFAKATRDAGAHPYGCTTCATRRRPLPSSRESTPNWSPRCSATPESGSRWISIRMSPSTCTLRRPDRLAGCCSTRDSCP